MVVQNNIFQNQAVEVDVMNITTPEDSESQIEYVIQEVDTYNSKIFQNDSSHSDCQVVYKYDTVPKITEEISDSIPVSNYMNKMYMSNVTNPSPHKMEYNTKVSNAVKLNKFLSATFKSLPIF